jgi:alpha-L-rhamnosidase
MKRLIYTLLLFSSVISVCSYGKNSVSLFKVSDLKCEELVNPLGLDNVKPHFSWKLHSGELGCRQVYYEIQVASDSLLLIRNEANLWRSGKVRSDASVMVSYQGETLQSRSLCYWRVRSWNQSGKSSGWSRTARFSIGILENRQFGGFYIGLSSSGGKVCSPLLRKVITLANNGQTAFLHVNSLGYHEIYINGRKVSDHVLSPAVSQLNKRSLIVTYDATTYLKKGKNDLLIWLGQGWYKNTTFGAAYDGPLVKAELDIRNHDKWTVSAVTNNSWKGCPSGYMDMGSWRALQFVGECVDGNLVPVNLFSRTLDSIKWYPVTEVNVPYMTASPQLCESNRIQKIVTPVSIKKLGENMWLVDMGKVLTGWFKMSIPELPQGQEIMIEYSDFLNDKGEFEKQGEYDIYITAGRKGEYFCNKFNHHAYRYARISNLRMRPEMEQIRGLQIYGDYKSAASFECSDSDLNAIHNMIQYTFKCLTFSGYMVDCPHLERTGYGGDGNSSTNSLQTMYDVAPTFYNWMQAWGDVMREGGSLPHVAPNAGAGGGGPYWCGFMIQAPWRTYMHYNDSRLISRYYTQMQEWLKYVDKYSVNGLLKRWPDTPYRDWYLGDWLAPIGVDAGAQSSVDLVNNCFISDCFGTIAKIATVLGKSKDAKEYSVRKGRLNKILYQTFYHEKDTTYGTGSQLDMAYPMLVGAVPDSLYDRVKGKLVNVIEQKCAGHIGCGLVGVPILTEWAVQNKEVDMIYRMLKKRDYPGYLYMMDHGATTTWESWNGDRSHVHNCYNGIAIWFYQAIGGIRLDEKDPAYHHVFIDPQIPQGVQWAKTAIESPYGTISVNWNVEANGLNIQLRVPVGIIATVCIPDYAVSKIMNGKKISEVKKSVDVRTGNYTFEFLNF